MNSRSKNLSQRFLLKGQHLGIVRSPDQYQVLKETKGHLLSSETKSSTKQNLSGEQGFGQPSPSLSCLSSTVVSFVPAFSLHDL